MTFSSSPMLRKCVELMRFVCTVVFNSLPNNKILDWSKLRAFADDKTDVTKNWKLFWKILKSIVKKEKNVV